MPRILLLALTLAALLHADAIALDSCVVPQGATYRINEHSVCRRVANNHASGSAIMVPTKNATEWSSGANAFINALPAGVTTSACPSCGGASSCVPSTATGCGPGAACIGGSCWHYGENGESCDTVCSGRGGCNLAATRDYAGSGGSAANCQAVLTGLGISGTVYDHVPAGVHPLGCFSVSGVFYRVTNHVTTCEYALASRRRVCACNN